MRQAATESLVDGKAGQPIQEGKSPQSSSKGDGRAVSGDAEQLSASSDRITLAVAKGSGLALGDGTPEQIPYFGLRRRKQKQSGPLAEFAG